MPIFEYSCQDCGTRFEKLVRRSEDEVACPSCGKTHLRQELSVFAAHANGRSRTSGAPVCPSSGAPCHNPGGCGFGG